jgi:DNA-binding PadR family transcriptional regulator
LLGLLSFGRELSGYELRKWAELTLAHFFRRLVPGEIYAELRRLESAGHVAADALAGEFGTGRRYRLTPAGEDALRAWLVHASLPPEFHLWLGHLHDPARLRALLRAARDHAARRAAEAASDAHALARVPGLSHTAPALRLAARRHADERDRLDALLGELRSLGGPVD